MITRVQTISELKQLFLEILLNKTNKVSDISDNSVLNGTAYGVAKVAQKCIKDIAIVESHIFPDSAFGQYLDKSATLFGVPGRIETASGSSTYVKLVANPGTFYPAITTTIKSYSGITFRLDEDVTMGVDGYAYAKVSSVDTGLKTNVAPNTIISMINEPVGHIAVTNEYHATGGYDIEPDEVFRQRIKKHLNIVSTGTIEYITQVLRTFNPNVLRVVNLGVDELGMKSLAIVLQNGATLSESELNDLRDQALIYFPVSDVDQYNGSVGLVFKNIDWEEIDVEFRCQIFDNYDTAEVRKNIQVNLSKYLDFRFWDYRNKVEWDDMLQIVKRTEGVKYVSDKHFVPSGDISVTFNRLPRVRGFKMMNMEGSVIFENSNLIPIFYSI